MKKFLFSLVLAVSALVGAAFGQVYPPQPAIYPMGVTQMSYISRSFHTIPFALVTPFSGQTTLVFDPSTSTVDQSDALAHMLKAISASGTNNTPLTLQVMPGVVNTSVQTQETRVNADFNVANSTTLTTVPFNFATTLQTGAHYRFRAQLYLTSGPGGSKIDIGGTSTTTNVAATYYAFGTTTIVYGGALTSYLSGPAGSASAVNEVVIEGEIDVGNGGTFVIQFAQSSTNATGTVVKNGSTLTVTQIP